MKPKEQDWVEDYRDALKKALDERDAEIHEAGVAAMQRLVEKLGPIEEARLVMVTKFLEEFKAS